MNHFHSLTELNQFIKQGGAFAGRRKFAFKNTWASIGSFDGVHRGHQALLSPMAEQAHAAGARAVVITFHPHPVIVLRGTDQPIYLTSPEERAQRMMELGIDAVVTLTFNRELASLSAEEFMQMVVDQANLEQLWVGQDFALGRNRQGDIPTLTEIGSRLGYSLHVVEILSGDTLGPGENNKISSSRIRELIRQGSVAEAARQLGRPYALEGPVMHGRARGRTLGFPTANVGYWIEKVTPALGVYATWAWVGSQRYPSVTNVGLNPTFDDQLTAPRVEAFLLDYTGDLYDQDIRVEFLEFIRPEQRFETVQALIDQMNQDTEQAREVLEHAA